MDNWWDVLQPWCKGFEFFKTKTEMFCAPIPKGRYGIARKGRTMTGYGQPKGVFEMKHDLFLRKTENSFLFLFFNKDMEISRFSKDKVFKQNKLRALYHI